MLLGAIAVTIALYFLLREMRVEEPGISFAPVSFAAIEGWDADDQAAAFQTLLRSCGRIKRDSASAEACAAAKALAAKGAVSREAARSFFEANYTPHRVVGASKPGLVTGYYEPEIDGARVKSDKFPVAAYKRPDDLVSVKPDEMRARDSAAGVLTAMRKTDDGLVPFYTREEIDKGALKGRDLELVYLDPVELFFMQVQGSGRVRLADGTHLRLGYSTKNGHPYTSIGKKLVELGEGKPKSMTMDGHQGVASRRQGARQQDDVGEQVLCVLPPARREGRRGRADRRAGRVAHAWAEPRRRSVVPRARPAGVRRRA